jgi:hypothetical protein
MNTGHLRGPVDFMAVVRHKSTHQDRDIFPTMAPWGNGEHQHAKTVIQVLSEPTIGDAVFQDLI